MFNDPERITQASCSTEAQSYTDVGVYLSPDAFFFFSPGHNTVALVTLLTNCTNQFPLGRMKFLNFSYSGRAQRSDNAMFHQFSVSVNGLEWIPGEN